MPRTAAASNRSLKAHWLVHHWFQSMTQEAQPSDGKGPLTSTACHPMRGHGFQAPLPWHRWVHLGDVHTFDPQPRYQGQTRASTGEPAGDEGAEGSAAGGGAGAGEVEGLWLMVDGRWLMDCSGEGMTNRAPWERIVGGLCGRSSVLWAIGLIPSLSRIAVSSLRVRIDRLWPVATMMACSPSFSLPCHACF